MINVIVLKMEYGLHAHTTKNHDGTYTIFLNSRDSLEMNRYWFDHELDHIERGDWEKHNVQEIETEAHWSKGG